MTRHYSEVDLLETYYLEPGPSMIMMIHLADCPECAARLTRLERKLRETAVCPAGQPEEFWARQRMSILRKIEFGQGRRPAMMRIAAAALLALVLGGLTFYRANEPVAPPVANVPVQPLEVQVPSDPWDSEPLQEFGSVVEWEGWLAEGKTQS